MESSTGMAGAPAREAGTEGTTQVGLAIACLGAALIIFNLFGLAIAGLFLAVIGAVLAAPGGLGRRWYWAVAGGAIVVVLSRLIADGAETLGGWLAVWGSIAILIGAILGWPTRTTDR